MRKHWKLGLILALIPTAVAVLGVLVYTGVLWPNDLFARAYPVRGVDVSAYQGQIDWPVLAEQGLDFAFIKATEGSGFTDPQFAENWPAAGDTGLRIGAYHFFSFDSPGETQAENFIATVPQTEGMLPPVVDVELYGAHKGSPPDPDAVRAELQIWLDRVEAHYGMRPVIYTLEKEYALYISGAFDGYDLWLRNVLTRPNVSGWTFWQYSSRARLEGYAGEERYIDMNVFSGSREAFLSYRLAGTE